MKIAIIVLVLVVVVFVVGTVAGSHSLSNDKDLFTSTPSWLTSLSGRLERKVAATDISAPCFQPGLKEFKVAAPAVCVATIKTGSDKYRKLVLGMLGAGTMNLQYNAPVDDGSSLGTQTAELSPSQSSSLVILSSGGQLKLSCAIGTCLATLQ